MLMCSSYSALLGLRTFVGGQEEGNKNEARGARAREKARGAQGNPGHGGEGTGGEDQGNRKEGKGGGGRRGRGRALEHCGAIPLYEGSQDGLIVAERATQPPPGTGRGGKKGQTLTGRHPRLTRSLSGEGDAQW